jgi:hypothetical protein
MSISQTIRKWHALPAQDLTIALRPPFDIATPTWFVSHRQIATARGSPTHLRMIRYQVSLLSTFMRN